MATPRRSTVSSPTTDDLPWSTGSGVSSSTVDHSVSSPTTLSSLTRDDLSWSSGPTSQTTVSSPTTGYLPWRPNVSLSEAVPLVYARLKAGISNLVGSKKDGDNSAHSFVLVNSPPESQPESPVGSPSLTLQGGPMRSSPIEKSQHMPEFAPLAVSPINHPL